MAFLLGSPKGGNLELFTMARFLGARNRGVLSFCHCHRMASSELWWMETGNKATNLDEFVVVVKYT